MIILSLSMLFFLSTTFTFADMMVCSDAEYNKDEPLCSIAWRTAKNSCRFSDWSDTSSWSLPIVKTPSWACGTFPDLSLSQKQRLIDWTKNRFAQYENSEKNSYYYTDEWEDYIQHTYFPLLQSLLNIEYAKDVPNYRRISVLHHLGAIIWYDYYLNENAETLMK